MMRYIFVGGLHRSGTSLIARAIASHPLVETIAESPAPENEGVYLQGAIPHTARDGQPGVFAFDPVQHLTESSRFNTLDTLRYLETQWDPWYPHKLPWRVEKSPVNLLRARLYQQLFPSCVFVFVVRHPVAVSMATLKWSDKSLRELLAHWQAAHALLQEDLTYLHRWIIVRYEDFVLDPDTQLMRIAALAELADFAQFSEEASDRNAAYLAEAPELILAPTATAFGYSTGSASVGSMCISAGRHVYNSITRLIEN